MRAPKVPVRILLALGVAGAVGGGAYWAQHAKRKAPLPAASASVTAPMPFEVAEVALDGGLGNGWKDFGRGKREIEAGQPARVSFGGFAALELGHEQLTSRYGALMFRIRAPERFGDFLSVSLALRAQEDAAAVFPSVPISSPRELGGGWSEVLVPFDALNPTGLPFDRIVIRARRMVPDEMIEVDHLVLSKASSGGAASSSTPVRSSFVMIDCSAPAKRISPLIYGIAHGSGEAGETARRIGGNAMTRLNWDAGDLWNTGSDWFFENVKGDTKLPSWLAEARASKAQMALTVPTIGWVAKDATSSGFPRSRFPQQRKFDEHRKDAGDGHSPAGKALDPGPPSLTSEAAPPERIQRWVETLRKADGGGERSVHLYMLDNEPDLWHVTHRDVHPEPVGYDELLDRTLRYGAAVRKADPEAVIAGPASWGWSGYFFSAKDSVAMAGLHPDRRQHGGTPLIPWYLAQLAAHEKRTGERILDMLDVHYYPQATGVYGGTAESSVDVAALRLRSTRSLWDPTYVDESWIKEPVQLLPRLRRWVDENYPGRGIVLGEWSFGGEHEISGALATAEALGRFAQHGVHAAFYWNKPGPDTKTFWGFRAFRNYDGAGAHFLEDSVSTTAPGELSAFASRDAAGKRLVLVLVNRDPTYTAELDFASRDCGPLARGRTFSYRGDAAGIVADQQKASGMRGLRIAPYSIEIVELAVER